jgi:hypothetical protein
LLLFFQKKKMLLFLKKKKQEDFCFWSFIRGRVARIHATATRVGFIAVVVVVVVVVASRHGVWSRARISNPEA